MFRLHARSLRLFAIALPLIAAACASTPGGETPPGAHFESKLGLILLEDVHRGPHGEEVVIKEEKTSDGRSLWGLEQDLVYVDSQGHKIVVPAGFNTDLASIPRAVWPLLPPDGPWTKAAVVHDFLYKTSGTGDWHTHHGIERPPYSREEADGVLKDGMNALKVSPWKRDVIWAAVRVGGHDGWGH